MIAPDRLPPPALSAENVIRLPPRLPKRPDASDASRELEPQHYPKPLIESAQGFRSQGNDVLFAGIAAPKPKLTCETEGKE